MVGYSFDSVNSANNELESYKLSAMPRASRRSLSIDLVCDEAEQVEVVDSTGRVTSVYKECTGITEPYDIVYVNLSSYPGHSQLFTVVR